MKQLWYIISKCDKIEIEKCEGWLCRLYIAYNYLVLNVCSVHGEKVVILHHPPSCSFPPIGFYPAMCNVHVVACVTIFENDLSLQTAFYTIHIHPWKKYIGREYTQTEQNHLDWRRRWYYRYFNCLCMEQFIKVSLIINKHCLRDNTTFTCICRYSKIMFYVYIIMIFLENRFLVSWSDSLIYW